MKNNKEDFDKIFKVIESCTSIEMLHIVSIWAFDYIDRNSNNVFRDMHTERMSDIINDKTLSLIKNNNI